MKKLKKAKNPQKISPLLILGVAVLVGAVLKLTLMAN